MKRNLFYTTWYTISLAGIVYTATIFVTIQRTSRTELAVLFALALCQLLGQVYFLHCNPEKREPFVLKCFLRCLQLSAIGVIACLCIAIYGLGNQYHNPVQLTMQDENHDNITIAETDALFILYPEYQTVEFVTEKQPSRNDEQITFCGAAAFQLRYNPRFVQEEIAALHVEKGQLYQGYELDGLGAFSFYDGAYHFANSDMAEEELKQAAAHGGYGFQSFMLVYDGEISYEPVNRYRCFRALAELDGKLCIIDAKRQMYLHDFSLAIQELGVENALYLDMGMWSYSWYRANNGKTNTLIGLPHLFAHNWIVFRK